jgi:hypothetical protein
LSLKKMFESSFLINLFRDINVAPKPKATDNLGPWAYALELVRGQMKRMSLLLCPTRKERKVWAKQERVMATARVVWDGLVAGWQQRAAENKRIPKTRTKQCVRTEEIWGTVDCIRVQPNEGIVRELDGSGRKKSRTVWVSVCTRGRETTLQGQRRAIDFKRRGGGES